jgi:hypothetical protein
MVFNATIATMAMAVRVPFSGIGSHDGGVDRRDYQEDDDEVVE